MSLRSEVEQLMRETMKDSPLVLEAQVFGGTDHVDSGETGNDLAMSTYLSWLTAVTLAVYRIAEEVDALPGTEAPETSL